MELLQEKFDCKSCSKSFTHEHLLVEHSQTHAHEELLICTICSETFSLKSHLTRHMQREHKRSFRCKTCSKSFSDNYKLTRHSYIHTGERSFVCKICSATFGREDHLKRHSFTHVKAEKKAKRKSFVCEVCSISFKRADSLKRHSNVHTNAKPSARGLRSKQKSSDIRLDRLVGTHSMKKTFSCNICMKAFRTKENVSKHKRGHGNVKHFARSTGQVPFDHERIPLNHVSTKPDRSLLCVTCSLSFASKVLLNRHNREKHADKTPPSTSNTNVLNCCLGDHIRKKKYATVSSGNARVKSLNKHDNIIGHKTLHKSSRPFVCSICQKSFDNQNHLINHIHAHRSFICTKCDQSFTNKDRLANHNRVKHPEKIPLPDSLNINAGKPRTGLTRLNSFLRKKHLKQQSTTKKVRKFQCTICLKSFKCMYHLNQHCRYEKFTCRLCLKSFCSKVKFPVHIEPQPGKYPFICHICSETYKIKSSLIQHFRTHLGIKPYGCSSCTKTFRTKTQLMSHVKAYKNEPTHKIKRSAESFFRNSNNNCSHQKHDTERNNISLIFRSHEEKSAQLTDKKEVKQEKSNTESSYTGVESSVSDHSQVSDELPFTCKICYTSFPGKSGLAAHYFFKHPGNNITGESPQTKVTCLDGTPKFKAKNPGDKRTGEQFEVRVKHSTGNQNSRHHNSKVASSNLISTERNNNGPYVCSKCYKAISRMLNTATRRFPKPTDSMQRSIPKHMQSVNAKDVSTPQKYSKRPISRTNSKEHTCLNRIEDNGTTCDELKQFGSQTEVTSLTAPNSGDTSPPHFCSRKCIASTCSKASRASRNNDKRRSTVQNSSLTSRRNTCIGGSAFVCKLCHRSFESKSGLITHNKFKHINGRGTFDGHNVKSATRLPHGRSRSGGSAIVCKLCTRSFESKSGLISHNKFKHINGRSTLDNKNVKCANNPLFGHSRFQVSETKTKDSWLSCKQGPKSFSSTSAPLSHTADSLLNSESSPPENSLSSSQEKICGESLVDGKTENTSLDNERMRDENQAAVYIEKPSLRSRDGDCSCVPDFHSAVHIPDSPVAVADTVDKVICDACSESTGEPLELKQLEQFNTSHDTQQPSKHRTPFGQKRSENSGVIELFICDTCLMSFTDFSSLSDHLMMHEHRGQSPNDTFCPT